MVEAAVLICVVFQDTLDTDTIMLWPGWNILGAYSRVLIRDATGTAHGSGNLGGVPIGRSRSPHMCRFAGYFRHRHHKVSQHNITILGAKSQDLVGRTRALCKVTSRQAS